MKSAKMLTILVLALGLIICLAKVSEAAPMGTAFTYQGRLLDANQPADGEYDFQFKLFDVNVAGSPIAAPVNEPNFPVIDGYFTVELDFGSDVFDGNAVWLDVGVRPGDMNDPNAYTPLSPRQEVTPVPYAIYAKTAAYAQTAGSDNDWMVSGNNMYSIPPGNVGIGTTNPNHRLDIRKSVAGTFNALQLYNQSPAANAAIDMGFSIRDDEVAKIVIQNTDQTAEASLEFWTKEYMQSISPKMIVRYDGNVGIGTTSPSEKLEVAGTVNATAFVGDGSGLTGITITETDPTVLASVKDGIDWLEVSSRPAGLDDGDDVGITAETDPTVPANLKDGVSWTEVANIPAGFADGIDNVGGVGDITAVYADNGLTGSATSGDAHLNVGAGTGISVSANAVALNLGYTDGWYVRLSGNQTIGGTKTFSNQTRFTYGIYVPSPGSSGNAVYVYNNSSSTPTIWARANQSTNTLMAYNNSPYVGGVSSPTIWAKNEGGGYAGYFRGDLGCTGSKPATVETQSYGNRNLYADESAEMYFFDRGRGQLTNGSCVINLDPMFLETVTINDSHPMLVQITLTADCKGVFVSEKTNSSFTVKELQGGTSNAGFDWEVAAKRKGYEDIRMEKITIIEEPPVKAAGATTEAAPGSVRIIKGE